MDTGSTKQMEDICRQQSPSFTKKILQQYGDMCHLNPLLLISFQGELSLQHFHTMEEGTPHVITGAFKLAYHRGHHYRQPGNQKYMLRFYNLEVTIPGLSKLELLISHCNCSRFFTICRH